MLFESLITEHEVYNDRTIQILGIFKDVKLFHAVLLVLFFSVDWRKLDLVFPCPLFCQ